MSKKRNFKRRYQPQYVKSKPQPADQGGEVEKLKARIGELEKLVERLEGQLLNMADLPQRVHLIESHQRTSYAKRDRVYRAADENRESREKRAVIIEGIRRGQKVSLEELERANQAVDVTPKAENIQPEAGRDPALYLTVTVENGGGAA